MATTVEDAETGKRLRGTGTNEFRYAYEANGGGSDYSPATWLSDYVLALVVFGLLAHVIVEIIVVDGASIGVCVYYAAFGATWGIGGFHHHLAYMAQKIYHGMEDGEEKEAKLERFDDWLKKTWGIAGGMNALTAAGMMVIVYWLVLEDSAAEVASIVTGVIGAILAVYFSVYQAKFLYLLPLPFVSNISFAVATASVSIYEGLAYALVSFLCMVQQQLQLGISKQHFNHNAVFHLLILVIGLPLLHLSALSIVKLPLQGVTNTTG